MPAPLTMPAEAEPLYLEWMQAEQSALDAWDNANELREKANAARKRLHKLLRKLGFEHNESEDNG